MLFPEYLKPGDTIGVTAPSGGAGDEVDKKSFMNAKKKLEERGYKVIFTDNVFKDQGDGRSSDKITRANEFMELIKNPEVKYICSAKGGDFLMEIQPYLDYEVIKQNPKWIQGYSDNTTLTFNLCTSLDMATVYCNNFGDFGMEDWHKSILENILILEGKLDSQTSFDMYQDEFRNKVTGTESYNLYDETNMSCYKGEEEIQEARFKGRVIGGCLDVVLDTLGTEYENVSSFIDKYKDDGIVWYLESFLTDSLAVKRNMWKLMNMGWFKYTKGIIFGRHLMYENLDDSEFDEAVMSMLKELDIPVIFEADIGHKPPQFAMVNGAIYEVEYSDNKLNLKFTKE